MLMLKFKPVINTSIYVKSCSARDLLTLQDRKCFYCSRLMNYDEITRDHFFPKCHNFPHNGNIVIACRKCNNNIKGNRYPTIKEILKFVNLYNKIKSRRDPIIRIVNKKPKFKLVITPEVISKYCY